jgi:hypothetical protein
VIFVFVIEKGTFFRGPEVASWIDDDQIRSAFFQPPHDLIEPRFRPDAIDVTRQIFRINRVLVWRDDDDHRGPLGFHPTLLGLHQVDPFVQLLVRETVERTNLIEHVGIGLEKEPALLSHEHAGDRRHADGAANADVQLHHFGTQAEIVVDESDQLFAELPQRAEREGRRQRRHARRRAVVEETWVGLPARELNQRRRK